MSPVPWTRTSPTPLARPLHAAPLYPAHTRHGEEARVPSNPGRSRCEGDASPTQGTRPLHAACVPTMPRASRVTWTRATWRGRARVGGCTRPLYTTHLLSMPRASRVTWTRATWRGRARVRGDARVPYTPRISSTCRVGPL